MIFSEILARERKARGLSQEELAQRVQVSRQAVSKWETGDAMPDLAKLLALADALEISLDTLCGRESVSPPVSQAAPEDTCANAGKGRSVLLLSVLLCALVLGLWAWQRRDMTLAAHAPTPSLLASLPESFTVTGVNFSPNSDYSVNFTFTPSHSGEGLTHSITFSNPDLPAQTFEVECVNGVCSGLATFSRCAGYDVTVSVSDGSSIRNLAVARGLVFTASSCQWTPLDE